MGQRRRAGTDKAVVETVNGGAERSRNPAPHLPRAPRRGVLQGQRRTAPRLKYAFDREDAFGNDHPVSPANRFYVPDIPQRAYDPEKARFHLTKAGMEGFGHELSGSEGLYADCIDMIPLYTEHAARTGIEIVPNRTPSDGYWFDVWLKHLWSASFWSGRPTEDWLFTQGCSAESNWNETYLAARALQHAAQGDPGGTRRSQAA